MTDKDFAALEDLMRRQRDALVALSATVVKLERDLEDAARRLDALEKAAAKAAKRSTSASTKGEP